MNDGLELKTYEFAYHLGPELEEASIKEQMQELESIVSKNGGSLLSSREPKKTRLSYSIKHKKSSHFGVIDFSAVSETIEKINIQLKLQHNVMRYLLIKKPDPAKNLRTLGDPRLRSKIRTQETKSQEQKLQNEISPKVELKPGQIEEELQHVLENIQ